MKQIVSVSLGSSSRNHTATADFAGQTFHIMRIGTDGDTEQAARLIRELDGRVDAIGLGGTNLYMHAGTRRYTFRESARMAAAAQHTPIVDGSGLKNTLERRVVRQLSETEDFSFAGKHILVVCAVDRFGLAEALTSAGGQMTFGDLLFSLGIDIPLRSLRVVHALAMVIAPIITRLPVSWVYPVGSSQTENIPRFSRYFDQADIIAGDFHYIRRYMPAKIAGKTVITNTVTESDRAMLQERGAAMLVTTTPLMAGRSFGTNVLEAMVVAYAGRAREKIPAADYDRILDKMGIKAHIIRFN